MNFVTYENRREDFPSLQLLVLSFAKHMPKARFHIPCGGLHNASISWLADQKSVVLDEEFTPSGEGWSIKPSILLHYLDRLGERVTWIDSDIIAQCNPRRLFNAQTKHEVILCSEVPALDQGSLVRTQGHGLKVGRLLPYSVNSSIVSVTEHHKLLLQRWMVLLQQEDYLVNQRDHKFKDRPPHHRSDQDVLTALLGSSEFQNVPIKLVRTWTDIVHSLFRSPHYPLGKRLATLHRGEPPLLHAQNYKVWRHVGATKQLTSGGKMDPHWQYSTYRLAAKRYSDDLAPASRLWMFDLETAQTRRWTRLFPNRPSIAGPRLMWDCLLISIKRPVNAIRMALCWLSGHRS